MIVATAGHIDHGKTLLVQALTGVDTDRLPEEKKRGMSIDLGFAYKPMASGKVMGFVDVPGHERFVRNMLAGVSGIDYALLVIAADDGPMPQTEEHLAILDLLGIDQGVVALTKTDRVDEARIGDVTEQIEFLLMETGLEGSEILPVSAVTGDGIDELKEHLAIASELIGDRDVHGNFRLAIDRAFTLQGAGLIVTGSVFAGAVKVGDQLTLSPGGRSVRVRGIHAQNEEADAGAAGQRCALNITGQNLAKDDVHRGDWLVADAIHDPVPRFDARLRVLPGEAKSLKHWTPVHVHLGAAEIPGRVAVLEDRNIPPGGSALVQIVLDRRIGALCGDGFILRDQSATRTIAGGRVLDPHGPARGRAKPERLAAIAAMEERTAADALRKLLDQQALGVDLPAFIAGWNLNGGEQAALWDAVEIVRAGEDLETGYAPAHWTEIRDGITAALRAWHENAPEKPGPSADGLRRETGIRMPAKRFTPIIETLVADGTIVNRGASYFLPGFEPQLSSKDEALWKRIKPILEDGHTRPPVVHDIAERIKSPAKAVESFLVRCARLGLVYRVAKNRFLLPDAVLELGEIAEALGRESNEQGFGAAAFRDRSGVGRNLAIEILEYFDHAGLTWRSGNERKVLKPAAEVFGEIST